MVNKPRFFSTSKTHDMKKVYSEISSKKLTQPKRGVLYISDEKKIVLCTSSTGLYDDTFSGVVIDDPICNYPDGYHGDQWSCHLFTEFTGAITLSND